MYFKEETTKLQLLESIKGIIGIEMDVARIKITHNLNSFLKIEYLIKYVKKSMTRLGKKRD